MLPRRGGLSLSRGEAIVATAAATTVKVAQLQPPTDLCLSRARRVLFHLRDFRARYRRERCRARISLCVCV